MNTIRIAIASLFATAIAALFVAALSLAVFAPMAGCKTNSNMVTDIEAMSEEQFGYLEARTDLITRVLVARLYTEGKVSAATLTMAAQTLELVAGDPLTLGGPNVITNALKSAGFTDQEAMLAILLVEDFLRQHMSWGSTNTPLGPHARHLVHTVAVAIGSVILAPTPSEEEKAQAQALLNESKNVNKDEIGAEPETGGR